MVTEIEIDNIFAEFGINAQDIPTYQEPENSKNILIKFEKEFNIDTNNVINGFDIITDILDIDVYNKWCEAYSDFMLFGGSENDINTISQSQYQSYDNMIKTSEKVRGFLFYF